MVIAFDNRTQTLRYRHTKSSHVTYFNQSYAWIFYSERRLNIKVALIVSDSVVVLLDSVHGAFNHCQS